MLCVYWPVSCGYTRRHYHIFYNIFLVVIKIYRKFVVPIPIVGTGYILNMNKNTPLVINYYSGWTYKEDGGMQLRVADEHKEVVVMSHTKRFHNCLYLLAGLSPCARNLMDWLTEEMTDTNIVYHTAGSRKIFNEFIGSITNGSVNYADQTIKQAWGELNKVGLLIAKSTKATFMVHPKFFFKGNDKDRINKIIAQLTFDNEGVDNFRVYFDKKLKGIIENK